MGVIKGNEWPSTYEGDDRPPIIHIGIDCTTARIRQEYGARCWFQSSLGWRAGFLGD
jgi:hypothetical protein